jgi:hypothetical protein
MSTWPGKIELKRRNRRTLTLFTRKSVPTFHRSVQTFHRYLAFIEHPQIKKRTKTVPKEIFAMVPES